MTSINGEILDISHCRYVIATRIHDSIGSKDPTMTLEPYMFPIVHMSTWMLFDGQRSPNQKGRRGRNPKTRFIYDPSENNIGDD
jgi:hypothetical protein